MEVIIKGEVHEIAALARAAQERRPVDDAFVDEIWKNVISRLERAYSSCGKQ